MPTSLIVHEFLCVAGLAALGSFLFPMIGRLLLPLIAVVLLLLTGEVNGSIVLAGVLSLVITAVVGIVGYYFLREERFARWLGARTQRPLSWILVKLKRDPIEDGAGKAAELRTRALAVLREGWALGSIGVAANLFLTYLILLAALRFVDVSASELSAADAFAAFAIAFWAGAVFPITGSGLGVVDAVLIAMLIELEQCLRRLARCRRTPLAVLLLGHHAPARGDHVEPLPQGEPATYRRHGTAQAPLA